MNKILLALILAITPVSHGQVKGKVDDSSIQPGIQVKTNYVINPSAIKNYTLGTTRSNVTVTRETGTGYKYDGLSSFGVDTTSDTGYVEWALNPISDQDKVNGRNCWAMIEYKGNGSLYSVQVVDQFTASTQLGDGTLGAGLDWTTAYVPVNCEIPIPYARTIRVTQTTAGTSPKIYIAGVTYGRALGFGTVLKTTGGQRYAPTIVGFGTVTNNIANWYQVGDSIEVSGRFTAGTSTAVVGRIGLPNSYNIDTFKVGLSQSATLGEVSRARTSSTTIPQSTPNNVGPWVITNDNTTTDSVAISLSTNTGANHYEIALANNVAGSGESVSYSFRVPIANLVGFDTIQSVDTASKPPSQLVDITSGSGNYVPTIGTKWIEFEMCGGGGGGSGSGTGAGTAATAGSNTTFGSFTANGGAAGVWNTQPNSSATCTIPVGAQATCFQGGIGGPVMYMASVGLQATGGAGGGSMMGPGGPGGSSGSSPAILTDGFGMGGGGGGCSNTAGCVSGAGGGGAACIRGRIDNPVSTAYSIGNGGNQGGLGSGGYAGTPGSRGRLRIREWFSTNGIVSLQDGMLYQSSTIQSGPAWSFDTGDYTESWSNLVNVTSLSANGQWRYLRIGKTLIVGGVFDIAITAASTTTRADFTLPAFVTSNFSNATQCFGQTNNFGSTNERKGVVISVGGSNQVRVQFTPGTFTGADTQIVNFTCRLP